MASARDTINDTTQTASDQIRQLRDQVDSLMRERVTPYVSDAASRAQDAARHAGDYAQEQAEMLSGRVRQTPLVAVLIAAGLGFVVGRIIR